MEDNSSAAPGNTTQVLRAADTPLWQLLLDYSQLVITLAGCLANLGTLIVLKQNKMIFSSVIRIFLMNQSLIDSLACLFAAIIILQKPLWVPNIKFLAYFICHAWHSQMIYWLAVTISTINLVAIAGERYYSICHPLKHNSLTKGRAYKIILAIYIYCVLFLTVSLFQISLEDGKCVLKFSIRGHLGQVVFQVFSVVAFLLTYCVPCALFFILYGMVIFTMYKRKTKSDFQSSRVINKATAELTKTAIIVTLMFIVCLGFDLWYYVLAYNGVIAYVLNSPIQKIAVWMAAMNTTCNPFIYALFMPVYRKCVIKTFCTCFRKTSPPEGTNSVSTISTNSTA